MSRQHAFTLLELVVSLASSVVLVAGLAGSLYISNQALSGSTNARQSLAASTVLRDLMADASEAKSISKLEEHVIEFTVPDRNEDDLDDTIRYAWSGTPGDPLTYQYNGGTVVNVATDVQAFALSEPIERELPVEANGEQEADGVTFQEMTEASSASSNVLNLSIAKPPGTSDGDLLIACIVTDGNKTPALTGWTQQHIGWGRGTLGKQVSFGVWWKIASSSDSSTSSYNFTWPSPGETAYAWIMRFTGHNPDPTKTINNSYMTEGPSASSAPACPPVTTTEDKAMILRLGGFDDRDINPVANPAASAGNLMNYSGTLANVNCSGGASWIIQSAKGDTGTSAFTLSAAEEYVTVTIAIAPEPAE